MVREQVHELHCITNIAYQTSLSDLLLDLYAVSTSIVLYSSYLALVCYRENLTDPEFLPKPFDLE